MPRVSIGDTSKTVEVNDGEILYDALFDRGLELPHGCLSGSCGACRIEVVSGKENLQKPGVIEADTINALREEFATTKGPEFAQKAEIRLSCRAKVLGDISIKLIK